MSDPIEELRANQTTLSAEVLAIIEHIATLQDQLLAVQKVFIGLQDAMMKLLAMTDSPTKEPPQWTTDQD